MSRAVVQALNERAGCELVLTGLVEQGQSGAAFVRRPDGRESVVTTAFASIELMRLTAEVLAEVRRPGIPVPLHELLFDLGDGTVAVVQERLPGSTVAVADPGVVDAIVAVNERFAGYSRTGRTGSLRRSASASRVTGSRPARSRRTAREPADCPSSAGCRSHLYICSLGGMQPLTRITAATLDVLEVLLAEAAGDGAEGVWGLEVVKRTGRPTGSVYPILDRLEQAGWLTSEWEDESARRGARRRLYRLTAQGATEAARTLAERRQRSRAPSAGKPLAAQ